MLAGQKADWQEGQNLECLDLCLTAEKGPVSCRCLFLKLVHLRLQLPHLDHSQLVSHINGSTILQVAEARASNLEKQQSRCVLTLAECDCKAELGVVREGWGRAAKVCSLRSSTCLIACLFNILSCLRLICNASKACKRICIVSLAYEE